MTRQKLLWSAVAPEATVSVFYRARSTRCKMHCSRSCCAFQTCHTLMPLMGSLREAADGLESLVDDDLWPLPTYQELLFVR